MCQYPRSRRITFKLLLLYHFYFFFFAALFIQNCTPHRFLSYHHYERHMCYPFGWNNNNKLSHSLSNNNYICLVAWFRPTHDATDGPLWYNSELPVNLSSAAAAAMPLSATFCCRRFFSCVPRIFRWLLLMTRSSTHQLLLLQCFVYKMCVTNQFSLN